MAKIKAGLRFASLFALAFLVVQAALPAGAASSYTLTLQTDSSSYSGSQPIQISGTVSPAPGPNTGVVITIKNSANSIADITEVNPNPSTGAYNYTSHPGGNAAWTAGTFSVNATWAGDGTSASQLVTFTYTPGASTTTTSTSTSTLSTSSLVSTSSTSTSSATSTTSTSSTTKSTSTTSTTSKTSSPVPEFPAGALAGLAFAAIAVVAVLSRRLSLGPARRS